MRHACSHFGSLLAAQATAEHALRQASTREACGAAAETAERVPDDGSKLRGITLIPARL
jgi:hypothetical protein